MDKLLRDTYESVPYFNANNNYAITIPPNVKLTESIIEKMYRFIFEEIGGDFTHLNGYERVNEENKYESSGMVIYIRFYPRTNVHFNKFTCYRTNCLPYSPDIYHRYWSGDFREFTFKGDTMCELPEKRYRSGMFYFDPYPANFEEFMRRNQIKAGTKFICINIVKLIQLINKENYKKWKNTKN